MRLRYLQTIASRALSTVLAMAIVAIPAAANAQAAANNTNNNNTYQNIFGDQIPKEQQKVFSDGIGYFDVNEGSACGAGGSIPAGTLPKIIPEPYNGAMTKGANTYKVAPALIAALFTEENFTKTPVNGLAARWQTFIKNHPDPNSGWPTNQFKTMGAFQFIPDTWYGRNMPNDPAAPYDKSQPSKYGYGVDGDGDGKRDAQNFVDGAAGAANYVAHNGATADKPPASWQNAIFAYNHAQWYVDAVMEYYNFYNTGGTADTSTTTPPPAATQVSTCTGSANVNCDAGTAAQTTQPVDSSIKWNQAVANKVVCLATGEETLWTSNPPQMKPGTDYYKYSYNKAGDWCGWFVSWIYKQAGFPLTGGNGAVGFVKDIQTIGQKGGNFTYYPVGNYVPKPGDMVIHGPTDKPSHVNIVSKVTGTTITMIGGNQSTDDPSTSKVSHYDSKDYNHDDITGFVSPSGSSTTSI